jgi:hypothetical protein
VECLGDTEGQSSILGSTRRFSPPKNLIVPTAQTQWYAVTIRSVKNEMQSASQRKPGGEGATRNKPYIRFVLKEGLDLGAKEYHGVAVVYEDNSSPLHHTLVVTAKQT